MPLNGNMFVQQEEVVPCRKVCLAVPGECGCYGEPGPCLVVSLPMHPTSAYDKGRAPVFRFVDEQPRLAYAPPQTQAQGQILEVQSTKGRRSRQRRFREVLDELDKYNPRKVLRFGRLERLGNEGLNVIVRFLQARGGIVERAVAVLDDTVPEESSVSGLAYVVMAWEGHAQQVLENREYEVLPGYTVTVREHVSRAEKIAQKHAAKRMNGRR